MHKKMMAKYQAAPKPPAFPKSKAHVEIPKPKSIAQSSGSGSGQHRTRSQTDPRSESHSGSSSGGLKKDLKGEVENNKPKKRVIPPPQASFVDLLRLAEQKSKEPVVIKKPAKELPDGIEMFEFGRPMTAKEKAKYMSEMALKRRVETSSFLNNGSSAKDVSKPSVESNVPKGRGGGAIGVGGSHAETRSSNKIVDQQLPKFNKKEAPNQRVPESIPSSQHSRPQDNRHVPSHMGERNRPIPSHMGERNRPLQSSTSQSMGPPRSNPQTPSKSSMMPQPRDVVSKPSGMQPKGSQEPRYANGPTSRPQPPVLKPKSSPEYREKPKKVVVPDPGYAKALFEKPSQARPSNGHRSQGSNSSSSQARRPQSRHEEEEFAPRRKVDKLSKGM
jgi:hypothetical protein